MLIVSGTSSNFNVPQPPTPTLTPTLRAKFEGGGGQRENSILELHPPL